MIVAYIDTYRARFGVEPICTVLSENGMKIAPSTYYARKARPLSQAALEEAYLVNAIVTLWQENWRVYGVRKLYHEARRTGLQVGRDTIASMQMAVDEINAKGGVIGRKLELVVVDESDSPETGIDAIEKLTGEEQVDVLIGGYTSGVTLAQLPHIAEAKTIYLGVGAASPSITVRVKEDYDTYKYVFRVSPLK